MTLINASAEYGTYTKPNYDGKTRPDIPRVNPGDPILIVHATIRNDYTTEHPVEDYGRLSNNSDYAVIVVTAYLYDKNGNQITAPDVTDLLPVPDHIPQYNLDYGDTATFDIWLLTSRRDIDHFKVEVLSVSSIHFP